MVKNKTIFKEIKIIFIKYKLRLLVSCVLIYVQAFFFNSVYYKFPVVLKKQFDFTQREISGYMLGLAICSFVSTLLIGPFFDILGRKKMLLITCKNIGM
jgi:MFS family permease